MKLMNIFIIIVLITIFNSCVHTSPISFNYKNGAPLTPIETTPSTPTATPTPITVPVSIQITTMIINFFQDFIQTSIMLILIFKQRRFENLNSTISFIV
jgi:hypothetical protein